jgi:flavorubredoxin
MESPFKVNADTYSTATYLPIPGMGVLPITWSLIKAKEPILVDTGMPIERDEFFKTLWSLIDPEDLKWIFLTHDDNDHAGNIVELMQAAPNARFVCNWVACARMEDRWHWPMDRALWLNPGQSFSAGDRQFTVVRPPVFDSPATLALYDQKTEVLFAADSCGAIIPEPTEDVADVPEAAFDEGFHIFARVLSPWVTLMDQTKFAKMLAAIEKLQAKTVVSCHAPIARGRTESLLKAYSAILSMEPFVGPDQAALEAMWAQMAKGEGPN